MTSISNIEEFLKYIHAELDTDILFECFVALVQEEEEDTIDLDVIPHDHHRRNYSNDLVPSARLYPGEPVHYLRAAGQAKATLFTSRSSILDYLSEDFVIEPDNQDHHATTERERRQLLEKSRDNKNARIEAARRFFKPLEVACNRMRVVREIREMNSLKNLDEFLIELWGIKWSTPGWSRFARTLHLVPAVLGDLQRTMALCKYVLGCQIEIQFSVDPFAQISTEMQDTLFGGQRLLGHNTRCGDRIYDYQEKCTLVLLNLTPSTFRAYFDERTVERKLLEDVVNHYFPLNVDVQLDFKIDPKYQSVTEQVPILGFSSVLASS